MKPDHQRTAAVRLRYRISRVAIALTSASLITGAANPPPVAAAETSALANPRDPIPRSDYKTWSLFLITNPEWLLDQSSDKLGTLYKQFNAFGKAIGPDNLAVWFWSEEPRDNQLYKAVDVTRSVAFCRRLKLKPSDGPYVLVMTESRAKAC
jgi:hypothetical protein